MAKRILIAVIVLFVTLPLSAEYLFLNDGSIIKGRIIAETPGRITFRSDEDKKVTRYPRADVMRVLYTEINMGRVYVQLRTGEVHRVFMVDEDRTTYTFRKKLYEPEEFKVKRENVLFMAERNPTGLTGGEPEVDRIELEWLPSFEDMRYYNVYYKKKGEDYGDPQKSRDEKYTLRGLDSNTEYTVKVTGYAGSGDETTASNEFTFVTANRPPDSPPGFTIKEDESGSVKMSWEPATDEDGEVVEYRVYAIKDGERDLLKKQKNTEYVIKTETGYERFTVTAVDDMGAESDAASVSLLSGSYSLGITAGIIYPMGNFADLAGMGYGGTLTFTRHDLFMPGLEAGVSAGFYYLTGAENKESQIRETDRSFFVPAGLNIGYRIKTSDTLSLVPYMTAGFAFWYISYKKYDPIAEETKDESLSEFGPAAGAGFGVEYDIRERTALRLFVEQGLLLKSGIFEYPYTRLELGMAIRF